MPTKYFIPILALSIVSGLTIRHVVKANAEPEYCEAPSNIVRETYLLDESAKWQKEYENMEDQWLQCTRDLTRVSEECNHDIICSEGTCEDR